MIKYRWPNGHKFAFTICDDTDNGTVENLKPMYDALASHGIKTTKTVWSLPCAPDDRFTGQSLSETVHREWILDLVGQGFEIGWHGARSGGSNRAVTSQGLAIFRDVLGMWPRTYANHANNVENVYWGVERFDNRVIRRLYSLAQSDRAPFEGSQPGGEYYWADICRERISYVRDFTFNDIVTTDVDPWMPYWDPRRPLVRAWFSSSDAADCDLFVRLLTSKNLDKLERSGGACILYVHFASGFVNNGQVRGDVLRVLTDLQGRKGWYTPVGSLLNHMELLKGLHELSVAERLSFERRWLFEHLGQGLATIPRRLGRQLFGASQTK